MLTIYCPTHNSDVLVGPRRIRRLVNTDRGVRLMVECYCGHRIRTVTGRPARAGVQDAA